MMKKTVLAASAAAVVLGAGTASLAATGGSSASPSASGSSSVSPAPSDPGKSAAPGQSTAPGQHKGPGQDKGQKMAPGMPGAEGRGKGRRPALRALGRALHAQWVTRDRDNAGAFVTHSAIRGAVTAVSASSITVKAEDGVSQTYAVTDATKVRLRASQPGNGNRGKAGTISDVHVGDKVAVIGTGATTLTAEHILDATE